MAAIRTALVVLFLLLASVAWGDDAKTVVRLGAVLPLSGSLSHLGTSYRDAMQLALEQKGGGTSLHYEILFEDDGSDLKKTATATQKLLDRDGVQGIVSMWSNQGKVVGPMAAKKRVPHFACAWDKSVSDADTTFNISSTPDAFMAAFVDELKRQKIATINVIELNDSGSISAHDELQRRLSATPIRMLSRERFDSGTRDFRSLLTKVRQHPADVLYINAGSPELELLAQQSRSIGIKSAFTTIGCFDFTTAPELFEGSWYMTMTWPDAAFIRDYEARFHRPIVYQIGNFYDAVGMFIQAAEASITEGHLGSEKLLSHLRSIHEYHGVLGTLTQDNQRAFQSPPTFVEIRHGKVNPLTR